VTRTTVRIKNKTYHQGITDEKIKPHKTEPKYRGATQHRITGTDKITTHRRSEVDIHMYTKILKQDILITLNYKF
jgi:hypothetical protein